MATTQIEQDSVTKSYRSIAANADIASYSRPETSSAWVADLEASIPDFRIDGTITDIWYGTEYRQPEIERRLSELDDPRAIQKVKSREGREFPMTTYLRIKPDDDDFTWVPGQFVVIGYKDTKRAYSIANAPDSEFELCVRRVPNGRLSNKLTDEAREGDRVYIVGPRTMDLLITEPSDRDLVFMSTGTGIAPHKSMIDYIFQHDWDTHNGEKRDVWAISGASWEDDLPYHEELSILDELYENFHYLPTVSREPHLNDTWEGETAYIQDVLTTYLAEEAKSELGVVREPVYDIATRIDPNNMELNLCGIKETVNSVDRTVKQLGVPERHYENEVFG